MKTASAAKTSASGIPEPVMMAREPSIAYVIGLSNAAPRMNAGIESKGNSALLTKMTGRLRKPMVAKKFPCSSNTKDREREIITSPIPKNNDTKSIWIIPMAGGSDAPMRKAIANITMH